MQVRPQAVMRNSNGFSVPNEQASETPAGCAKQQRLLLAPGISRCYPSRSREAAKPCPRPKNKQARPLLVVRSWKGMSLPEEQAGTTLASHPKQQRLVLARGTSRRDPNWLRELAKACPCMRKKKRDTGRSRETVRACPPPWNK